MAEVTINNLTKKYDSYTVLEFEEWKISNGTIWIKGGNGTGKSTLFKIIAGQIPFKGEVMINTISLRQKPVDYRALISYAEAEPQYPALITGNELLDYHIRVRKSNRKTSTELVEEFNMGDFMDNKIGGYSSGMLKKLSLICAFTGDAELFILDEPLITIDIEAANVLYKIIQNYRNQGKTLLISSHQEIDKNLISIDSTFQIQDLRLVLC